MVRLLLVLMFAAFIGAVAPEAGAADKEKIRLTLGWQPTMNGARFFVAERRDYSRRKGWT